MSQVLRMQLTHMQTRPDSNEYTQRESLKGRRERMLVMEKVKEGV